MPADASAMPDAVALGAAALRALAAVTTHTPSVQSSDSSTGSPLSWLSSSPPGPALWPGASILDTLDALRIALRTLRTVLAFGEAFQSAFTTGYTPACSAAAEAPACGVALTLSFLAWDAQWAASQRSGVLDAEGNPAVGGTLGGADSDEAVTASCDAARRLAWQALANACAGPEPEEEEVGALTPAHIANRQLVWTALAHTFSGAPASPSLFYHACEGPGRRDPSLVEVVGTVIHYCTQGSGAGAGVRLRCLLGEECKCCDGLGVASTPLRDIASGGTLPRLLALSLPSASAGSKGAAATSAAAPSGAPLPVSTWLGFIIDSILQRQAAAPATLFTSLLGSCCPRRSGLLPVTLLASGGGGGGAGNDSGTSGADDDLALTSAHLALLSLTEAAVGDVPAADSSPSSSAPSSLGLQPGDVLALLAHAAAWATMLLQEAAATDPPAVAHEAASGGGAASSSSSPLPPPSASLSSITLVQALSGGVSLACDVASDALAASSPAFRAALGTHPAALAATLPPLLQLLQRATPAPRTSKRTPAEGDEEEQAASTPAPPPPPPALVSASPSPLLITHATHGLRTGIARLAAMAAWDSSAAADAVLAWRGPTEPPAPGADAPVLGLPLGLIALLSQCRLDRQEPTVREWGLLSIRNLCAASAPVCQALEALKARQVSVAPELAAMGVKAAVAEDGAAPAATPADGDGALVRVVQAGGVTLSQRLVPLGTQQPQQ